MGKGGGKFGGLGGPRGGTPGGGKFGAGRIPGPQVQANLNNHANMQNPTSSVFHAPGCGGGSDGMDTIGPLMGCGTGYDPADDYYYYYDE